MSTLTLSLAVCFAVLLIVMMGVLAPLWQSAARARRDVLLLAVCMVALSAGGYYLLGGWRALPAIDALHAQRRADQQELMAAQEKAKAHPEDAQVLDELGRALGKTGAHAEAEAVLKKAVLLSKGRADIILDYATAQIFAAGGTVTKEAVASLDMVLMLVPGEPKARYFKAIALEQAGKTEEGRAALNALAAELPKDHLLQGWISKRLMQPQDDGR